MALFPFNGVGESKTSAPFCRERPIPRNGRRTVTEETMSLEGIHARRSIGNCTEKRIEGFFGHRAEFNPPARRCNPERVHSDCW